MIAPDRFVQSLEDKGFTLFSGVPCSYFTEVIRYIQTRPQLRYVIAPNEGSALAIASGASLGKKHAVVMIQNSGLGNLINPLTSLNCIYNIPVLILISGRAYGISDEPQHEIMGKKMTLLLESLDIPYWELPQEESQYGLVLAKAVESLQSRNKPVVLLVKKGTFGKLGQCPPRDVQDSRFSMKRMDALQIIREFINPDHLVFATTGMPSREFFVVGDRPGNFYMQGSMGHIAAIALGTALSQPDRQTVVIDGDGAFLMHMGIVSAIGHYQPKNFFHLVIDNESYETTGAQDTTSVSTDFGKIALACGYQNALQVSNAEELRKELPVLLKAGGPSLLRIKVNRLATDDIPRISTKYSSPQITELFMRTFDLVKK